MTWTYTGNPVDSPRDALRFYIGDTVSTDEQLSDEECDFLLTDTSPLQAAIAACDMLIAKYSRYVSRTIGSLSITAVSMRIQNYGDLRASLATRLAMGNLRPYAGGISIADKTTREGDTDRVVPTFTTKMLENVS